jgi:hypothetical protein
MPLTPEQRRIAAQTLAAMGVPEAPGGFYWHAVHGTLSRPPDDGSDVWRDIGTFKVLAVKQYGWLDDDGNPIPKGKTGGKSTLILAILTDIDGAETETVARFTGLSSAAMLASIRLGVASHVESGLVFSETPHVIGRERKKNADGTWYEPYLSPVTT